MTKKQARRLSQIKELLSDCKSFISETVSETYEQKKVKKHIYVQFRERLNTLQSETQLKKLKAKKIVQKIIYTKLF